MYMYVLIYPYMKIQKIVMKGQTVERNTIDYYILPNKILCNIVGIWPIEETESIIMTRKSFAYFRVFFALTAVSSVLVPEILAIIMNWGDIDVLTGKFD